MPETLSAAADLPPMLGTAEIAKLFHLHPKTAERMVRTKRIPAVKVGYRWLVRREDVVAIMAGGLAS